MSLADLAHIFDRAGHFDKCPGCGTSPAYYTRRVAGINDWVDACVCPECGHEYPITYQRGTDLS